MVLEMRRALEELKSGDSQGYRKLYNATYEEAYVRSLLIIQKEEQMMDFMKDLFRDLFTAPDEAEEAEDLERWFLQKFYQRLRKHYHRLLEKQEKPVPAEGVKTLAGILGAFPLLHRIMLVMAFKDDFTAGEISAIFGLGEEKIQTELNKLEKALPSLVKDQPESQSAYLANWKVLLLGASREVLQGGSDGWVESMYKDASSAAGIALDTAAKKSDDFDYFVADPEPEPEPAPVKPKKKPVPIVEEEPEDEEEYDDEDEEPDDDDEYDDDDEDEDDDRYDWDMEDDGKRMVILGIVLALIIVAVIGLVAFRILGKGDKDDDSKDPVQTEQDAEEDGEKLIVKGGEEDFGEEDPESDPEEAPEEDPGDAEAPEEEVQTVVMKVKPDSMRIRSEPNTNCEVVTSVKAGDRLEVIGEASDDGWVQVRCIDQDGKEGYAKIENLAAE